METKLAKLTDTQRTILAAAAERDSLLVLPFPKSLKLSLDAARNVIQPMLKSGLVEEVPAVDKQHVWRSDDHAGNLTLVITAAGLETIGIATSSKPGVVAAPVRKSASAKRKVGDPKSTTSGTKISAMVTAMRSKKGASIAELIHLTGWQAHSVRGAISGAIRKKLQLTVQSEPIDGRGRVYRIAG